MKFSNKYRKNLFRIFLVYSEFSDLRKGSEQQKILGAPALKPVFVLSHLITILVVTSLTVGYILLS